MVEIPVPDIMSLPLRGGAWSHAMAFGIGTAAEEMAPVALARPQDHLAAATGAARRVVLADGRMALPQVGDMGGPLFFPDGALPFRNDLGHFSDLRHLYHGRGKVSDEVRRLARIDDIRRHFGLEGAVARERDDAVEKGLVESKTFRQGADVQVVLAQRILESALPPIDRLRPLGAILIAENPPRIGLRLDDEDAVLRDNNVVDLRRRFVR